MTHLLDAFGRALVRRRGLALLAVLTLTALAVLGALPRVREGVPIDFTPQAIFEEDRESRAVLERLRAAWPRDDNDLVLILDGPVWTPEGVQALRTLATAAGSVPGVVAVDSLVGAVTATRQEGGVRIGPLLSPSPDEAELAAARAAVAGDPSVEPLLVSADGTLATVRVRVDGAISAVSDLGPVVRQVGEVARSVPLAPGFTVAITGVPQVRVEVVELLLAEQVRFFPLASVLFAVVLVVIFRKPLPALLPLFTVGLAVLWATGLLLAMGVTFNVFSELVPTLVLVIGLSDGIHILARYREELEAEPAGAPSTEAAMGRTVVAMAGACLLTSVTTAVGFGSLATASSRVIRDFGLHAAVAVLVAYVAVLVALPTLLAWVPARTVLATRRRGTDHPLRGALAALDRAVARWPRRVLAVTAVFTALALGVSSQVRTDSHMMEVHPTDHPQQAVFRRVEASLGGIVPVVVHLEGPPDVFRDPAILGRVHTLAAHLRSTEHVGWVTSPADAVASVHHLLTGERAVPDDEALLAQELLLLESAGPALGLDRVVDADFGRARVLALTSDVSGHWFVELGHSLQAYGDALFAGTGVEVVVGGDGVLASAGIHRIINDLLTSVGLAFGVILLTLAVALRNLRLAAAAMIPNALPLLCTLAVLVALGDALRTSNVVSFAVALGLAVDDTIHFLVRLRQECQAGGSLSQAISRTFRGAGEAIVLTSVLLAIGLGVLTVSDLNPTRDFAVFALATVASALVGDLLVLPALLHVWGPRLLDPMANDADPAYVPPATSPGHP